MSGGRNSTTLRACSRRNPTVKGPPIFLTVNMSLDARHYRTVRGEREKGGGRYSEVQIRGQWPPVRTQGDGAFRREDRHRVNSVSTQRVFTLKDPPNNSSHEVLYLPCSNSWSRIIRRPGCGRRFVFFTFTESQGVSVVFFEQNWKWIKIGFTHVIDASCMGSVEVKGVVIVRQ